jgi:hypothetical protein
MCIALHAKYPLFLSDFNENLIFSTDFRKYSEIKFSENPSGGSRVFPCGQTDRQTDIMKLIVAFRKFANPPKRDWRYAFTLLHASTSGTGT